MPRGNPSPKLAITIDPEVHKGVVREAARDKISLSAWLNNAAADELRRRKGLAAVALWEEENGKFTEEEREESRRRVRTQLKKPRIPRRTA